MKFRRNFLTLCKKNNDEGNGGVKNMIFVNGSKKR